MKEPDSPESNALDEEENKEEDETLDKEERRKKARLRTRGPYSKAHANW
jgi:hypothetical protein